MKILITLLKPLSFLPALLMMYIIFSFSAQPGEVSGNLSYKISYEIIETKSELLSENLSSEEIAYKADGIHYYVRKAAHMTEYFCWLSLFLFLYMSMCERNLADASCGNCLCGICRAG